MSPTDTDAYALLEALFVNAPVGLGFWDTDLRYRRVNPTLAGMHGIAPDDHLGRRPGELLGRLGTEAEALMERVLRDRAPQIDVPLEGETPARPGEPRRWRVSLYPVSEPGGDLIGVAAVMVEVTAEHEARVAQQATSALLDAIFSAAPVGIAFWDTTLRYRRVNEALAGINGIAAADHLGRRPDELLGELGREITALLGEVAVGRETIVDRELSGELPGGSVQFRHATIFPVLDGRGDLAGLAGVVRDVTAHHDAEAERNRLLRDALIARAGAEAAQVRAEAARRDAEAARRRADILGRAGDRLARVIRDYEATLQEVARVAVPLFADRAAFTLVGARGVPRTVAVAPEGGAEAEVPEAVQRTLRTGESQLSPSAIIVALPSRGRVLGALRLERTVDGAPPYTDDDLRMTELLAVRAALSVENARLYTERSHIAQTLQRSLLPPALPAVPGLELAARYRAAGEQNEVGGDFYDVFRAGDGRWTVIIGDVSGKGAEAAALTSLTRHTLRAASLRTLDPIENLGLLNEALWAHSDPAGRFCTVLFAQVRPDSGGAEVTLATGGHLPPRILRAGGRVERLQLRGTIVGGVRTPTFGERRVRLDHDDLLLLFTDGVVELRRGAGVMSGDDALEQLLARMRGASAHEVVEAVERQAVELQGGDARDDIALVAIRPRP